MNTDTNKKILTLNLPPHVAGLRLDLALVQLLCDFSRSQIQHWLETQNILVNGMPAKAKYKVKGGEMVTVEPQLTAPLSAKPEPIPLNIVFEDEALLVINKPIGLVVHPGAGNHDKTLLNALLYHDPALAHLPRAGILHRLDKNTSGLLMIAKTLPAFKHLTQQLKHRTLGREYQAIVYGTLISGGTVDAPIERHPIQRKRMYVSETGKRAITHYRIAEKFRAHTHLYVRLETGRTHQIRVHLSHIHRPIIGDSSYGGRVRLAKQSTDALIEALRQFRHQALHAYALTFAHPTTEETLRVEIALPNDMSNLLTVLREDSRLYEK